MPNKSNDELKPCKWKGFDVKDNNCVLVYEGDRFRVQKHMDSSCCEHFVTAEVRFNPQWNAHGLQDIADGEWLSGMGIIGGYSKDYQWNRRTELKKG